MASSLLSLSLSPSLSPSLPSQSSSPRSNLSFSCPAGNRIGNYPSLSLSLSPSPIALFGPHRALRIVESGHRRGQVVRMAPEGEKMTRRSPLDFPIEWERPKPGRRPDIFPQFSPMKSPLPPPMPADPPEEDEDEEEEKEEEEEEEPQEEEKPENPE